MADYRFWGVTCLLVAYWVWAPVGAGPISDTSGDVLPQWRRSLLAATHDVSSPDVSLNGACAADIVQHCRHLLTEEATGAKDAKANSGQKAVMVNSNGASNSKPLKAEPAVEQTAAADNATEQKGAGEATAGDAAGDAAAGGKTAQTQEAAVTTGTAAADGKSRTSESATAGKVADLGSGAAEDTAASGTTQTASGQVQGGIAAEAKAANEATAAATKQQQQQQLVGQQRRRLLAGDVNVTMVAAHTGGGATAVTAELNSAAAHSDDLNEALQLLGLQSELSSRAMAKASAPIARCLLSAMHASEMSINPNIPILADGCKAEVRAVLIQRASDMRYDPPLLAACSHDIVAYCGEEVGPDSAAVTRCLKDNKQQLLPLCRTAITARQAAAAEDMSLDPELQRSCGIERDKLCLEAGWGEGAAQACLLGHLQGSLPQVFSRIIFPFADGGSSLAKGSGSGASNKADAVVELSANCSAALVRRLMEEGEDIRFNYRLSAACAGDKQLLCRDVRPGGAAVLNCLERHLDSLDMSEECREALGEVRQLRSLDVRLDHTFTVSCAGDVRSLCEAEVADKLDAGLEAVPFGLSAPFECLRSRLDLVRDATCRRHMYESIVAAYMDNRRDAGLMRGCHQEVALLCPQHPARALECLQGKIEKFSREDSPAVLKGKISEQCMAVVLDRRTQAATDVAFVPDLMEACAREQATMCSAPDMEGVRALDCLVDRRNSPGFSERCGEALREYLADAAQDIRTMAGLNKDCGGEIRELCKGVQPGEGRVISCLRDQRASITGEACRQQVMRLLGFMVEDHRMDVRLTQACTADMQKYCGGVEEGDGQVHACLRRSADHLSPECRAAEEEVERLEHEDVRLNPTLMRECPLAISGFCAEVPPGDARVISCLQANMDKGHFPAGCRLVIRQLTDRAAVKYSLNFRLRQECNDDTQRLCPEAVDELGGSKAAVTGAGGAHREETTLACLARQSIQLASGCRSELQALVKLSLNRYRVGMPLTSQCDGDVMQRCQVDQMAAPFLQSGYVLRCLAKHAAQLHKPCWELVSTMDEGQFKRAAAAETTAWQSSQSGDLGHLDEKVLERLAANLRRELEPRIYNSVHEQINRKAMVVARNVTGALVMSIAPKVNALVHTTVGLLGLTLVGLVGGLLAWRKFLSKGGNMLVVRKDGRV